VTALGLLLAAISTVAINGGFALQHAAAAELPPLRGPRSWLRLFLHRRWLTGFLGGTGGWALYVVSLRLAPLSLVQAAAAGGIGVLALGAGRLEPRERLGIAAAVTGLALLGLSLGSHTATGRGHTGAIALWMACSAAVGLAAVVALRGGAALGTAAGLLYAAGDVGTKAAVTGGTRLWFVPALLACHGLAFLALQVGFQRGRRLATAGVAMLWTNALPIAAGMALFGEALPPDWLGAARVAAFAFVLAAAVALSTDPERAEAAAPALRRA
jgi:hypothetical protein